MGNTVDKAQKGPQGQLRPFLVSNSSPHLNLCCYFDHAVTPKKPSFGAKQLLVQQQSLCNQGGVGEGGRFGFLESLTLVSYAAPV